jgi:hypothetical protein
MIQLLHDLLIKFLHMVGLCAVLSTFYPDMVSPVAIIAINCFWFFFNLSVLLTSSKISKYGNTFQMYDNLLFITIWFIIFIVFILQTFQLLFVPSVYPAQVWSGPIQLIVLSISIVVKLVSGQERFYESVHIRCYLIPPVILVKTTHQLHVDLERNIQHHVSIIILSWNVFLASHTNIKSSDTFHF